MNLIRKLLLQLAPITVIVDWERDVIVHKSWNCKDALAWASCYPADAMITFLNRRSAVIAWRA
jgi:hypothetical protein